MNIMMIAPKIRSTIAGIAAGSCVLFASPQHANSQTVDKMPSKDLFEKTIEVSPKGTNAKSVLLFAPSPDVEINGEEKRAAIVVDLSKNILYKYNENGQAEVAYLVASGKKKYPTDAGIRMVTHVESYPYKSAPAATRRRRRPNDYGPRIICLETVDPKTGNKGSTGEFIHGNNNPASLGKYASLGCIRMDNEVIKELSKQVKRGDIVIINK